jgi:hypothetical protein
MQQRLWHFAASVARTLRATLHFIFYQYASTWACNLTGACVRDDAQPLALSSWDVCLPNVLAARVGGRAHIWRSNACKTLLLPAASLLYRGIAPKCSLHMFLRNK